MKIDRLIGIISLLTQKDSVTAAELAEQFEVSKRTINRDIDLLCQAGIPIVTRQGAKGGISILENYKAGRTVLTKGEMRDILAGLRGLDSVTGTKHYGQLMEKLSVGSSNFLTGDQSVLIDLSSWYGDSLKPKIETVRRSIDSQICLKFQYFSPKGESFREIEPYYLIFRWSSWYLWGWCKSRGDFRLFKLNRMEKLQATETRFIKRPVPLPDLSIERIFPGGVRVKALFKPECKWRLIEEFGPDCFAPQPDGKLLFHADYTDRENLLAWLLTFGDKATLLEPEDLRQELRELAERMTKLYVKEEQANELPETDA